MASLPSYFERFLRNIRPTEDERGEMKSAHETLREQLWVAEDLKDILVADFLQGSYRRFTATKQCGDRAPDVDLVVVTTLHEEDFPNPGDAQARFTSFLDTHYPGSWEFQGRSIAISLDDVKLDLVITSAPSEAQRAALADPAVRALLEWDGDDLLRLRTVLLKAAEQPQWKLEPLRIPDREAVQWEDTHPLEQIRWTIEKNAACTGHYINVVKPLKWWRIVRHPDQKYPKGYPFEHMLGDCCPDGIDSVAAGVVATLEEIRDRYATDRALGRTPDLRDRGVNQNVWKRITPMDFCSFYDQAKAAAETARRAFDLPQDEIVASVQAWQELFGDEFPDAPEPSQGEGGGGSGAVGGFTVRERRTNPTRERFA